MIKNDKIWIGIDEVLRSRLRFFKIDKNLNFLRSSMKNDTI